MSGEPFENFTCSMCSNIVLETHFRLCVVREEHGVEKMGLWDTSTGCRDGNLSIFELCSYSRVLAKKHRLQQMQHWSAQVRISQLKMKCPMLKESTKGASDQINVYKFCTDVIAAHRTGAMGGNPALWDYIRDVASN